MRVTNLADRLWFSPEIAGWLARKWNPPFLVQIAKWWGRMFKGKRGRICSEVSILMGYIDIQVCPFLQHSPFRKHSGILLSLKLSHTDHRYNQPMENSRASFSFYNKVSYGSSLTVWGLSILPWCSKYQAGPVQGLSDPPEFLKAEWTSHPGFSIWSLTESRERNLEST